MDKLKQQIEQKLIANVLIDKCAHCDSVIFRDAWCTQERVIRFTTPFFREIFPVTSPGGKWETGDSVMYEVNNSPTAFVIHCVFSPSPSDHSSDICGKLLKACGKTAPKTFSAVVLKFWDFSTFHDVNKLFDAFDAFLSDDVPAFENELKGKLGDNDAEVLKEGAEEYAASVKYERNPKARAECLAAHGTACAVCGIDFGKEYGPEFAGKIEVHHIVPLHLIGTEYTVDPVKDLVPVCPNCHTALHSKKDGVYTVEELKAIRSKYSGK